MVVLRVCNNIMIRNFLPSIILSSVLLFPYYAFAQSLVPCSGNECGTCQLVQLADNVTKIIIALGLGISVLIFMYAGWLLLSSAGNSTQIKRGKDIMLNVLVGLVIILSSWLIVDVMLKTLLPNGEVKYSNGSSLPWNKIACSEQKELKDGEAILPGSSEWPFNLMIKPIPNSQSCPL